MNINLVILPITEFTVNLHCASIKRFGCGGIFSDIFIINLPQRVSVIEFENPLRIDTVNNMNFLWHFYARKQLLL